MKRFSSRKFLVFVVATLLLWFGKIDPQVWFWVAVIYIGGNLAKHLLDAWRERGDD